MNYHAAPARPMAGRKEKTMKKDELEQDYETFITIKSAFADAMISGNAAELEKAGTAHETLLASVRAKGSDYSRISRLYNDSRERGNEYIDLSEPYQYEDAEKLLTLLRDYGFDHVTMSSGWTSAVETAWQLCKLGCTIEGMVEINGISRDYFNGNKYDLVPAYLFRLA